MKPRAPSSNAPADETALSVTLHYEFSPTTQRGAALGNPLVALLEAVREAGSIAQAAHLLDCSYRHILFLSAHLGHAAPLGNHLRRAPGFMDPGSACAAHALWRTPAVG